MIPIAVSGIGVLVPDAFDVNTFWDRLAAEHDAVTLAGVADFGIDPSVIYDPGRGADKVSSLWGGWLRGFSPNLEEYAVHADELRPYERTTTWPLHVAREALRDAGDVEPASCGLILGGYSWGVGTASKQLFRTLYDPLAEETFASWLGDANFRLATEERGPLAIQSRLPQNARLIGKVPATLARALGLGGPRYAIDAACAASFYGLKLAALHLAASTADAMLVIAASHLDAVFHSQGFSAIQALPAGGRSRPLDARSEGMALAEGACAFVVRPLDVARRIGSRIYGVIRAIGLASDGGGKHIITPNAKGQLLACKRAYEEGALAPSAIDYVECHATGTPVGDPAEAQVIAATFGAGAPLPIGTLKSNFGHLLSASGGVALAKVLLALEHETIPPTIGVEHPVSATDPALRTIEVVRKSRSWPRGERVRRAALNAFGFGGTNAHLIVEEDREGAGEERALLPAEPLAVIGLDAAFGSSPDLASLRRRMAEGRADFRPPGARWRNLDARADVLARWGGADSAPVGSYIDALTIDALRYRLPPRELAELNPQALLALTLADSALRDAGIARGSRTAVAIAIEGEPVVHRLQARWDLDWRVRAALREAGREIPEAELREAIGRARDALHTSPILGFTGNLVASRVTALWDFNGPNLTVSAEESGPLRALSVADLLLRSGEADAVVVGAVDLAGSPESVLLRRLLHGTTGPGSGGGFDQNSGGWQPGEGGGIVVVKRLSEARAAGDRIHAVIDAVATVPVAPTSNGIAEALTASARAAFATAATDAGGIAYVDGCPSGLGDRDLAAMRALADIYGGPQRAPAAVLADASAQFGHPGAASGMLALIRAIVALEDRFLPSRPGWTGPRHEAGWGTSLFRVPERPLPWFRSGEGPRRAAIHLAADDDAATSVILSEGEVLRPRLGLDERPLHAFPVFGDSVGRLLAGIAALESALDDCRSAADPLVALAGLSAARLRDPARYSAAFATVLVAATPEELLAEAAAARTGVPASVATGRPWQTPAGSAFFAEPLGERGKVAFVYGGVGGATPGVARDVFAAAPEATRALEREVDDLPSSLRTDLLYPAASELLDARGWEAADAALREAFVEQIPISVAIQVLYTRLLDDRLRLRPAAVFGYCLGEIGALVTTGLWRVDSRTVRRILENDCLQHRIGGRFDAARDRWSIPPGEPVTYATRVLLAPIDTVRAAVDEEERVYLTSVNAPGEVMIAGDPAACERVIERVGCDAFAVEMSALHSPIAQSEKAALRAALPDGELATPGPAVYLAARPTPISEPSADRRAFAEVVAEGLVAPLDFPALVERVYADGARVFVEIGPGVGCTRWLGAILRGRSHAALSVDRRGTDGAAMLTRLVAVLISHRVGIDLDRWAELVAPEPPSRAQMPLTVALGGPPLAPALGSRGAGGTLAPPTSPRATPPAATSTAPPISLGSPAPVTSHHSPPTPTADTQTIGAAPAGSSVLLAAQFALSAAQAHSDMLARRAARVSVIARSLGFPAAPRGTAVTPQLSGEAAGAVIFDEAGVLEFADGRLARVLGPDFADVDGYRRRIRVPGAQFTAISRVTALRYEPGVLGPGFIRTEYDIPRPVWHTVAGKVPHLALDAQGILILLSCMGIDRRLRGERAYRWLDATILSLDDLPVPGDRVVYDINLERFAEHGETLLCFTNFLGTIRGRPVLRIDDCCAGFFSDAELASGGGIGQGHRTRRETSGRRESMPAAAAVRALDPEALVALAHGDLSRVFGAAAPKAVSSPAMRLPPPAMHMIDRIVEFDPDGGVLGLGCIVAEKDLDPSDWFIRAHFQDDPVFAGPCMIEGSFQTLKTLLLAGGFYAGIAAARFEPVIGLPMRVCLRGQVPGKRGTFTYRLQIVERELDPVPFAVADVELISGGRVIGVLEGLGLQIVGGTDPRRARSRLAAAELAAR